MQKILPAAAAVLILICPAVQGQPAGFPGTGSKQVWLKANGLYDEGNRLLDGKKYAESIAKYQAAIALYPFDVHYHYNLGLALKKKGDYKAAATSFKQALAINKSDWKIWKGLGNSLYKDGQYADAIEAFKGALACNPPAREIADIKNGIAASSRLKSGSR